MAHVKDITIRPWTSDDDYGIWSVLKDGSYSLVSSTFKICLSKNVTKAIFAIVLGICIAYKMHIFNVLLLFAVLVFMIYLLSWMGAVIYLHGSTLLDIKDISKSYFEDPDHHFWVAVCDGNIAGTIAIVKKIGDLRGSPQLLKRNTTEKDPHNYDHKTDNNGEKVAWLRRMVVSKNFRGFGIARKLVLESIQFCQQRGYHKIFLITTEVHHAARSLYSKLGFRLSAIRPYTYIYGLVAVQTFEYEMDLLNES